MAIELTIAGGRIALPESYQHPVARNVGMDSVSFTFDGGEPLAGMTKAVTFYSRYCDGVRVDYADEIAIPSEAIPFPCDLFITITGYDDDTRVCRTIDMRAGGRGIIVEPCGRDSADYASPETLTWAAGIDELARDLEAKRAADYWRGERGPAGAEGAPGQDGADGISPSASVERVEGGAEITITDAEGTTTAIVYDGQGGGGTSDFDQLTNRPSYNGAAMTHGTNIPEVKTSTWDGKYSKPSGGIPKSDLASAVQESLGKADSALQSFTETDPTVPSWAKQPSKPSYTAAEVGALPSTTTIPSKTSQLTNDSGFLTQHQSLAAYRTSAAQDTIDAGKLDASHVTHETWTFTLDDDTTVTKEVALWTS